MKYLIITASLLLGMMLGAQTKVTKKIAAKSTDFGITYTLPKTSLVVTAEVIKITAQAGPYFRYAEKYLGVKNPVAEDKTYYQLGKVTIENKGIPDPENTYIVEFKPGTVAPYAYLSEEGFLCSINAEYELKTGSAPSDAASSPALDATNMSVFTEELLMAGSTAKQAEVAAKQIYRIRESRMNLLTGDADNMPPDGDALKLVILQLESQEKGLTNLFTGTTTSQSSFFDVSITPYENLEREVLFRFSDLLGIVDADDLGGMPVYINLKSMEPPAALVVDTKEAEKKEKQMKGIIYNVPGKAQVEIVMNRKSLLKGEVQIVQFGRRENLVPVLFEDKKTPVKVFFYPETGAIKQIIQ